MSRRTCLAALLVLVALAGSGSALVSTGSSAHPSRAHVTGRLPARTPVSFTLLLRARHGARFARSLAGIEDPGSPRFRSFIGPRRFGRRFGLADRSLTALRAGLRNHGLTVTAAYPQRTALTVRGSAAAVGRWLHVGFVTVAGRAGQRWHAPIGHPRLPPAVRGAVAAVAGLSNRPVLHPAIGVPYGGLTPTSVADAYDVGAMHRAGFLGQGMRIAIISFSDYDHSNPSTFEQRYGLGGPAPEIIKVDGGTGSQSGADEANLDIDVVKMIAPDAQILFYEAPPTASAYPDMINRIVADGQVSIISSSWGSCERQTDPAVIAANQRALKAATAAGISMFVATGDSGAYDCQSSDLSDHRLTVDSPAASAYAIAVGGTRLNLSPADRYESESAWNDPLSNAGGGGGFTTIDPRPSWQSGPGVDTSIDKRGLPDVSADADQATGWSTYDAGNWGQAGGTSAATPFWAASMLLIQQYVDSRHLGRIGFADPILYALARSHQPYPSFHDVTTGTNRYYAAHRGWDPATGLGSPDVDGLAHDIAVFLSRRS